MNTEISLIVFAVVVFVFTTVAMVRDIRTRRLPNWLTVSAFAAGVLFHVVTGAVEGGASGALSGLGYAMGGFGVGFGILFVLWLIGGGGGGDVKLAGAVGAWLGATHMFIAFVASAGIALVISMGTILYRASLPAPENGGRLKQAFAAGRQVPYAVPLTLATWAVIGLELIAMAGDG